MRSPINHHIRTSILIAPTLEKLLETKDVSEVMRRDSLGAVEEKSRFSPVITGMGVFSAGGRNVQELWHQAKDGRVTAELYSLKEKALSVPVYRAGDPSLSVKDYHLVRQADRSTALLLAAAREAWTESGLSSISVAPERRGIIIGSSRGPIGLQEKNSLQPNKKPSASVYSTCSSMAGVLAAAFATEGPAFSVSSTCTSSATALSLGMQFIQSGALDVVVVGGVDAPLVDSLLWQYATTGIVSLEQSPIGALRPFDQDRTGTVLGEGAAVIILESAQRAAERGAAIKGRVRSVALQGHAQYRVSLDDEGAPLKSVLKQSLQQAELEPSEIGLVHLHGTGTERNDLIESHAVTSFFGKPENQPLIWATKAITGHPLGASSLMQLVLSLEALRHSWVPPIAHCSLLDPDCLLRVSKGNALVSRNALCLNSGFWGNVSSLIVSLEP